MSDILELLVERPVAGGRMLARHDGRVVFVSGAIPGERVRARVERSSRQALWAAAVDIVEASADRRDPPCDPSCGGAAFAHIRYERQQALKQAIIVDAFRRIARIALDEAPAVAASPERGYRVRSRLHAAGGRVGFYREGTHALCDAGSTHQLSAGALPAAEAVFASLGPRAADCGSIVVCENVAGTERVIHLEPRERARLDDVADRIAVPAEATGVTTLVRGGIRPVAGADSVSDDAAGLFGDGSPIRSATWARRAPSFFQANRFLIGALLRRVLDWAPEGHVADLYSGVGLFAVACAARGDRVLAVESEPFAAADLQANARPYGADLRVVATSVEAALADRPPLQTGAVVLDPPRAGLSPAVIRGLSNWNVPVLVYVSCDPPTLARDVARLAEDGYRLEQMDAFDLFPNTPHVECVARLRKDGVAG